MMLLLDSIFILSNPMKALAESITDVWDGTIATSFAVKIVLCAPIAIIMRLLRGKEN